MSTGSVLLYIFAVVLGALGVKLLDRLRGREAEAEARNIIDQAHLEIANRKKEAELEIKELTLREKERMELDQKQARDRNDEQERQLNRQKEALDQRADQLSKQERAVEGTQRRLSERLAETDRRSEELAKLLDIERQTLHQLTGLSKQEATTKLLEILERELTQEAGQMITRHKKMIADTCNEQAKEMLLTALQRYAAGHTADSTTSTVGIPNDEMKGRIIGREGRNIRAFEKETGVDVIIDDTPGVVVVSAFDPVRREVARLALTQLITDGRIHPSHIEEVVNATREEVDRVIRRQGEDACQEVNVVGVHEKVVYMLGRLHFRTSYSQNVLRHSVEVAFLSGLIAEMMGYDESLARRCGLLHDIGKAADHDLEGGHPKIGADILKRHGERPEVVHAALGHHDEIITSYPYTMIVATADACSASRPGARRETLERYIKRMEELETIATGFDGIEQAFAVQAGREVRVIANASKIDDAAAAKICRDIAKAFEQQLTYPGEIKVTLLRESRFTEVAH